MLTIFNQATFETALRKIVPGDQVVMHIFRDGNEFAVSVFMAAKVIRSHWLLLFLLVLMGKRVVCKGLQHRTPDGAPRASAARQRQRPVAAGEPAPSASDAAVGCRGQAALDRITFVDW